MGLRLTLRSMAWLGHFTCHLGGNAHGVEFRYQHMEKGTIACFLSECCSPGMSRFPPAASHPPQLYHRLATTPVTQENREFLKALKLALTTLTVAGFMVGLGGGGIHSAVVHLYGKALGRQGWCWGGRGTRVRLLPPAPSPGRI